MENNRKRPLEDDGSLSSSSTSASSLPLKKRIHRMIMLAEQAERVLDQGPARQDNEPKQAFSRSKPRPRFLRVHWDLKPQVFREVEHPDFDPSDVWYSRQEYDEFMSDRMRTVKCLRASGGDDGVLDPLRDCLRGLEPFQTAEAHHEMHSKRQFHNNAVLLEQIRQSRLDKSQRDPERFRDLVSLQSEIALRRAQHLARSTAEDAERMLRRASAILGGNPTAPPQCGYGNNNQGFSQLKHQRRQQQTQQNQQHSEHHMYHHRAQQQHQQKEQHQQRHRHSMSGAPSSSFSQESYHQQQQQQQHHRRMSATNTVPEESPPSIFECGKLSPMSDRVRHLQQLHAQKLMNLYNQRRPSPSSVMSTYTLPDTYDLDCFPVRRDSLYGDVRSGGPIAYLPSVRRASLASAQTRMALRRGSWEPPMDSAR